jgi:cyclophilin family peptidyl-prolyl cis-trans isomerase
MQLPIVLAAALAAASVAGAQTPTVYDRLLAAEDARAGTAAQLEVLRDGLRLADAELRAMAVRALGRLERAEMGPDIAALLTDPDAAVRTAAAHALAQALVRGDAAALAQAREAAGRALAAESDPVAAAALAESMGRLRHAGAVEAAHTISLLEPFLVRDETSRLGAVRGFYFLARQQPARPAFEPATLQALRLLAAAPPSAESLESTRARTLALATLVTVGAGDAATLEAALADPQWAVRREATAALASLQDLALLGRLLAAARQDANASVRYEALRVHGRRLAANDGCAPIIAAVDDADAHVALLALDLLGTACGEAGIATLIRQADGLPPTGETWHRAVHALVSLAARQPAAAAERLPAFMAHENLFVRSYAARAAAALADEAALRTLAQDAHPNVRTAAVQGLRRVRGRAADDVYIAQLGQDDSQLLQNAAAALEGSGRGDAVAPLLDALDRVSAARRETSRDGRRALLRRVQELGDATVAARVEPYLGDFDPEIATLAADLLGAWTGTRPEPRPAVPPRLPLPTASEVAELEGTRVLVTLADGGEFEMRLFARHAPTNVARFVRLARAGYYDGLTLHRVVPNFVVQGGSPNANEYTGDGPFSRDEVGRPNWRGSVGLSTRGRDTGDAQLYINTIDNVRLDHDYTVWADIVRNMEVVDRLQEGAVMVKLTVIAPPR